MAQTEAAVFADVGEAAFERIEVSDPGPGQVRVRTRFSTISAGTEGWILHDRFTWNPTCYPCVPGYQRAGTVEALGSGVSGWAIGDRVMATRSDWPGTLAARSGAHAAVGNTLASELFALPGGVGDVDASGLVVAQVGYNAASRARIEPGDPVVVYGDGLIGQCAAQAARARGARVILVGHRAERLELAAAHSADAVVNGHGREVVEAVRHAAGSEHVTAVLDSVQSEQAQRQYTSLLARAEGQIVYCGFTPGTVWADMALLQQRELTAHFVSGWTRPRMEATLDLMARGQLSLEPLITHLVPATRAPEMYRMIAVEGGTVPGHHPGLGAQPDEGPGHRRHRLHRPQPDPRAGGGARACACSIRPGPRRRPCSPAPPGWSHPSATDWPFVQADITDEAAMLAAMDGMDAVIHLAGEPRGLPEIGVATFRDNALGTFVAIDTARRAGVGRFFCASSINAFGTFHWRLSGRPVPYTKLPLDEDVRPRPGGSRTA